jgi:agmatine/peptidylarginine deiminase
MTTHNLNPQDFYMPAEWEQHEGTWLQWPNNLLGPKQEMKPQILEF